jgi:hypothetical protein
MMTLSFESGLRRKVNYEVRSTEYGVMGRKAEYGVRSVDSTVSCLFKYLFFMPQLLLDIPHSLGQEEATRRLKEKFAAAQSQYQGQVSNYREEWQDHTFSFGFHALGMAVTGTVAVAEKNVKLTTTLPLAAAMFKGAIEKRIRQEMGDLLVAAPAG